LYRRIYYQPVHFFLRKGNWYINCNDSEQISFFVEMEIMSNNRGYTIWEVLTVVAIAAVIAAIAVPSLMGPRGRATLDSVVDNLRGDLQLAKSMAIRESTFVVVNFQADQYEIFVDNGAGGNAGNWFRDADERMLRFRRLTGGVSIDLAETDFAGDQTRFNDRGLPENLGSVFVEDSTGDQRQVRLNRLGRLTIQ
jgi:prepilin-type N-terminal cleavage/methylation domain-containing protein